MASLKKVSVKIYTTVACMMMLLALTVQIPGVHAEAVSEISFDPSFSKGYIGDNITITIRVANVENLFSWQVALKYNGTVINCSAVWVPDDNVFAGQVTVPVEPQFGNDTVDGLSWILFGNSLLLAPITVSTGILCRINFTVLKNGETTILIATKDKPVQFGVHDWDLWDSFLEDPDGNNLPYTSGSSTIVAGSVNAKPIAIFSVVSPKVANISQLVLVGHSPPSGSYAQSYAGFSIGFNASTSYDPDGNVTSYVWYFGDGNLTTTSDSFITHAYSATGRYTVVLFVVDDGEPPGQSNPTTFIVVVGLVLQFFDWSPFEYTVLAIIAIAIVAYVAMKTRRELRRRSEKKQKMLAAKQLTASSTVVKTK